MSEATIYGIDLGTTYSSAAFVTSHNEPICVSLTEDGRRILPSAVLLTGDRKAFVGDQAIENSWMPESRLIEYAKRDIGLQNARTWEYNGWVYTPEEVSSLVLRKIALEIKNDRSLPPIHDVVISHPQYFFLNQKEATREAGELAGLNVVATITEPNAAAIAYGMWERSEGEQRGLTVLVFDLGGGTFDVTLMKVGKKRFEMIASDGDSRLGGINWDAKIEKLAKDKFRVAAGEQFDDLKLLDEGIKLRKEAQKAKEELSRKDMHSFWVEAGGSKTRVEISRSEFEHLTRPLVLQCIERCETLFEKAGYSWGKIDQILMVGSSTKMPMIQTEIKRVSGKPLIIDRDPKQMVAKGAAIWGHWVKAGIIDARWGDAEAQGTSGLEVREGPEVSGCTAHGLGVLAQRGGREIVRTLVHQNTATPAHAEETFYTASDNATSIMVPVYEGESEEPDPHKLIGQVPITDLPPRPKGSPVKVRFNIDLSGRLEVEITDIQTGRKATKKIEKNILRPQGGEANGQNDPSNRRHHLAEIEVV